MDFILFLSLWRFILNLELLLNTFTEHISYTLTLLIIQIIIYLWPLPWPFPCTGEEHAIYNSLWYGSVRRYYIIWKPSVCPLPLKRSGYYAWPNPKPNLSSDNYLKGKPRILYVYALSSPVMDRLSYKTRVHEQNPPRWTSWCNHLAVLYNKCIKKHFFLYKGRPYYFLLFQNGGRKRDRSTLRDVQRPYEFG